MMRMFGASALTVADPDSDARLTAVVSTDTTNSDTTKATRAPTTKALRATR